jgi:hypothetical protein
VKSFQAERQLQVVQVVIHSGRSIASVRAVVVVLELAAFASVNSTCGKGIVTGKEVVAITPTPMRSLLLLFSKLYWSSAIKRLPAMEGESCNPISTWAMAERPKQRNKVNSVSFFIGNIKLVYLYYPNTV